MSEEKIKGILKKMHRDPRTIYTILWIFFTIPYLFPMGLPISITERTREGFDIINALQPGDNVILSLEINAGAWGELGPGGIAITKNLFRIPGIKIVIVSFDQEGPMFADQILNDVNKYDKEYGEDYVLLGWVPGGKSVGGSALADDIHKVFAKDFYGNFLDTLPIMENIRSHEDIALVVDVDWGAGIEAFLYQWVAPYGTKVVSFMTNQMAPTFEPHYNAGNLVALMVGIRGSAEYEILAKTPGLAAAATDAISIAHSVIILSIIAGNIIYFMERRRK